jgi:zinc protease
MKYLLPIILLLTFVFTGYSQMALSTDAAVTEFDVNGLKVIFKRRSSSPTVTAGLFVRGGVANQTALNAGIENLTLSAATEASKKYPREAMRKELARTGTSIGAATSFDFGVMSLTSTSQNFARSWDLFTDVVFNPMFEADDVDRVRNLILAGLRNETASPDSALEALEAKVVYAGHPYANSPTGTIETVTKLTPADLRAYHQTLLQSSRLLLVIVGDADVSDIKKYVTASFSRLPRGTYKDAQVPQLKFAQTSLDITSRTLTTNYIKGIFAAPSMASPDYYAMRVAMAILQSRVYQEVRIKRNLSYAPNAEMDNRAANTANIYVTAVDANQAVRVMLAEVDKLRKDAIDEDEFGGVPGYFLTTFYADQETNAAQARELAQYELMGGGWQNSAKFLDGIRGVKPADILAVSVKYMKNIRFVVIGDPKVIDRALFLGN